jgi:murein DD-endopeptidase MepM/ murein hydrolase activator NlpD
VQQGNVLAYVGMTGTATGPHLHYEYRINGTYRNPATIPMPRTEIPARYLSEFHAQAGSALARLDLTNNAPQQRLASR